MESKTTSKIMTTLKAVFLVGLASAAFNVYAHHGRCHCYKHCYSESYYPEYCNTDGGVYYGNPNRPYTIWVDGRYDARGCWHQGYYLKILGCVKCDDIVWAGDHWQVRPYRVVVYSN